MIDLIPNARALRLNQTEAEKLLWKHIRNKQLQGYKFKRQHPVTPYIVDFFCEDAKLIVELNGGQHSVENDAERTKKLQKKGSTIMRFWNNDLLGNIEGILETILKALQK